VDYLTNHSQPMSHFFFFFFVKNFFITNTKNKSTYNILPFILEKKKRKKKVFISEYCLVNVLLLNCPKRWRLNNQNQTFFFFFLGRLEEISSQVCLKTRVMWLKNAMIKNVTLNSTVSPLKQIVNSRKIFFNPLLLLLLIIIIIIIIIINGCFSFSVIHN
jgi:hypothetical protein